VHFLIVQIKISFANKKTMPTNSVASRAMKYFAELIGSFLFISVIFVFGGTVYAGLPIGFALAACIFAFGYISGGSFNPAVTTGLAVNGDIDWIDWAFYVICEVAGAIAALYYVKAAKTNGFIPNSTVAASGVI